MAYPPHNKELFICGLCTQTESLHAGLEANETSKAQNNHIGNKHQKARRRKIEKGKKEKKKYRNWKGTAPNFFTFKKKRKMDIGDAVMTERLANNQEVVNRLRTVTTLVAAIVAGLLGVTGWFGAVVFLIFNVLAFSVLKTLAGTSSKSYFIGGSQELFSFGSLTTGMLTFVFVWTIVYDSVYIF